MAMWFAAGSVAIVWSVFRSPAVDYRMVALGALLGSVELPFGAGAFQTLALSCAALFVVMAATVGRRLLRRRALGLPIGMFLRLVLDGSWADATTFWWPVGGGRLYTHRAPTLARGLWSGVLELAGVMVALWLWGQFGFDDPTRRRLFLRTGRLDPAFVHSVPARTDRDERRRGAR